MKLKMMWMLAVVVMVGAVVLGVVGCASGPYKHSPYADGQSASEVVGTGEILSTLSIPHAYGVSGGGGSPSRVRSSGYVVPRGEEVWVIEKGAKDVKSLADKKGDDLSDLVTSGMMVVQKGSTFVPVPLKHTDVKGVVSGYVASVVVTQQFENPYNEKIEAVYVFPLPENAGINEFVMTVGERKIRGIIREREEAAKIYEAAKRQGYVASLMSQERANIFTQKVANIEPGKKIDVQIRYFNTLSYQDGWYEWVFPMVVGPRYNPAGSTDGVGAVARDSRGASGQKTEVQYLKPTERSGHDISLAVELNAGVTVEEIQSVNHAVKQVNRGEGRVGVTLSESDAIPNKDFVLRYKVAGKFVKSAMFVQKDAKGDGGFFTLMLVPPEELKSLPRRPVEMVFVVDTSGSMSGAPIAQAKEAVTVALSKMEATDTFQIVQFASSASQMAESPLSASAANRRKGEAYVQSMTEGGGTEMLAGINKALDFPRDENRTRVVAFLTDGYIGNEAEILRSLYAQLADSRVFSFGVGSSPNRYLMDSMAAIGNGAVAYLSLNEKAEPVMDKYFERISHPALTNIAVKFEGMQVSEVYPKKVPDLFVGKPVVISGRYRGTAGGEVVISGKAGKEKREIRVAMSGGKVEENAGIRTVWARMKIAALQDAAIREDVDVSKGVKEVALEYGLMSPFTSFVAVDSLTKTAGEHGTTVAVPVPVPEGVKYETTVEEK